MPKVELDLIANNKASGNIQGVTKSLITAQLAVEGLKIATRALIDIGKQAIEKFKEQEKQEKQLETVLKSTGYAAGLTAEEIKKLSSSLSEQTTFADEAILSAQNLLLTFTQIGQDVFPQATETVLNMSQALGQDLKSSAIQLGKALNDPITGAAALRRVGVSLTEQQMEQIRVFQESGDILSAQQIIINELGVEFGGAARAARDTFGGALDTLTNIQNDNLEAFGNIIQVIGKDYVNAMIDAQKGLNNFLKDVETIETIEIVFNALRESIQPFLDILNDLMDQSGETSDEMSGLEVILKVVASAFVIISRAAQFVYNIFVDLIKIAWNLGQAMGNLWDLMFGNKEQKEAAKKAFGEIGESFKKMGTDIIDIGKGLIDDMTGIWDGVTEAANKSHEKALDKYKKHNKDLEEEQKKSGDERIKTERELWDEQMQERDRIIREADEKKAVAQQKEQEQSLTMMMAWMSSMLSVAQDGFALMQEANNQFFEDQLATLEESLDTRLEDIDNWMTEEMDRQGVREETESERLQREILEKQQALRSENDADKKSKLEEEITMLQTEQKRAKIRDEAQKKKEKAEKDAAKKETELKKKQFEMNKAFSIAQIWINAAQAVLGFWAAYASIPIAGPILAGVLTALVIAMAGVQCHGKGTKIKLYNGNYKNIENITKKDILCGNDDTPRNILALYKGKAKMYKIIYNNYEFTCTYNHILSLYDGNNIKNIPLEIYLKLDNKEKYKLYRQKGFNKIYTYNNFIIGYLGEKDFYGFEIDGNHLYKLDNDLVTHNTGLVASQTFHGQEGGLISKGQTTGDNAVLYANKGEALFRSETYQNMEKAFNEGNFGNNKEENNFSMGVVNMYGVSDPETLTAQLKEIKKQEKVR